MALSRWLVHNASIVGILHASVRKYHCTGMELFNVMDIFLIHG